MEPNRNPHIDRPNKFKKGNEGENKRKLLVEARLGLNTIPFAVQIANFRKSVKETYFNVVHPQTKGMIDDARIEQKLLDDSLQVDEQGNPTILNQFDYESMARYVSANEPENEIIYQIRERIADHYLQLQGINLTKEDIPINSIIHVIIDYLCAGEIDFFVANESYSQEDIQQYINGQCGNVPEEVSGVPLQDTGRSSLVNKMTSREFDQTINTGMRFGTFDFVAPMVTGEQFADVPYDPVRGKQYFESRKSKNRMNLANEYINNMDQQIIKLADQYEQHRSEQEILERTIAKKTKLSDIKNMIDETRRETNELRIKLLTPIKDGPGRSEDDMMAANVLSGLSGGKKKTRQSKKHRKTKSKTHNKSKTHKKSKKSRK